MNTESMVHLLTFEISVKLLVCGTRTEIDALRHLFDKGLIPFDLREQLAQNLSIQVVIWLFEKVASRLMAKLHESVFDLEFRKLIILRCFEHPSSRQGRHKLFWTIPKHNRSESVVFNVRRFEWVFNIHPKTQILVN